jgi:hypothetical protein
LEASAYRPVPSSVEPIETRLHLGRGIERPATSLAARRIVKWEARENAVAENFSTNANPRSRIRR